MKRGMILLSSAAVLAVCCVVTGSLESPTATHVPDPATAVPIATSTPVPLPPPPNQQPAPTPIPYVEGEVLFEDDFEDGDTLGWEMTDHWQVVEDEDGNHVLEGASVDNELIVAVAGSPDWTDYALTVRAQRISRSGIPLEHFYGVRMAEFACDGYLWYVLIHGTQTNLDRNANCEVAEALQLTTGGAEVPPGEWISVRLTATGNVISGYLNDTQLFEVADDARHGRLSGSIALGAGYGETVWFDDVRVVELSLPE